MRFSFNQLERLFSSHQREFFVALLAVAALATQPEDLKAYVS
jgi:hypothetical protein